MQEFGSGQASGIIAATPTAGGLMPTGADVQILLTAAGLVGANLTPVQELLDFDGAAASAVGMWERDTHYEPFLAAAGVVTVPYEPRDLLFPANDLPMLDLDGGFVSVTSLLVGVTPNTPAGKALVAGTDYILRPSRAPLKGKPYTYIEFYRSPLDINVRGLGDYPDSIRVTGLRGYSLTVPALVWNAVRAKAALILAPEVEVNIHHGLLKWTEADATSESYGASPLQSMVSQYATRYGRAVQIIRRPVAL